MAPDSQAEEDSITVSTAFLERLTPADRALPQRLLHLLENSPDVTYADARVRLLDGYEEPGEEALDATSCQNFLVEIHKMLKTLEHRYHNLSSHIMVASGIFLDYNIVHGLKEPLSERDIIRKLTAIWCHDVGHVGNTYRQITPGAIANNMSNEEFSVLVVLAAAYDMGIFTLEDLDRIGNDILASTFFQRPVNVADKCPALARSYEDDRDDSGKIIAFVDVAYYLNGTDAWLQGGLDIAAENGMSFADIYKFLDFGYGFLHGYVRVRLAEIEHLLKPESYAEILLKLEAVLADLTELSPSGRNHKGREQLTAKATALGLLP